MYYKVNTIFLFFKILFTNSEMHSKILYSGGIIMAISYEPLWIFLNKLHISKMDFAKRVDISNATLAKMGKNEPVTLTVIEKICTEFNCNIKDVVTHISEKKPTVPPNLLKPGTIVNSQCPVICGSAIPRINKAYHAASLPRYCVILKETPKELIGNEPKYLIAPILLEFDPECIFDIPFSNAQINEESKNGYIQLSKMGITALKHIDNVIGEIPKTVIDSINSQLLLDLVNITLKYNLASEIPFYNMGFDTSIK